ncbi:hypothetical protein GWK47_006885 [Chionoecetes opilio]|uniref:Uncharacterized protein n=1 Tax=Chionoecetes opilio TaxID=41210 RepID=A0A8J4Y3J9_CHIOP|nr:hypothetical protein GWK47_006885 [Chionoecetes opilio]
MECEEDNKIATAGGSDTVRDLLNVSRELAVVLSKLGHNVDHCVPPQPQGMVLNRQAPTFQKFSGKFRRAHELDEWVKNAEENVMQVDVEVEGRVVKDSGIVVKHCAGETGVVQGTHVPVLLGMNVLAELVSGRQNTEERTVQLELGEKWGKCVRAVEARLRVLQQPLGWAVVQQHQDLVVPAGYQKLDGFTMGGREKTRAMVPDSFWKLKPRLIREEHVSVTEEPSGRWLTTAQSLVYMWTRKHGLTGKELNTLEILVKCCLQVYFKLYYDIKVHHRLEEGPKNILTQLRG